MKNISLLYDEDCPLCRWYTRLFVKHGILPESGRIPYINYVALHPDEIDTNIAQTKIACVNHQTNQVLYGIDGLLLILGNRFKIIEVLGNFKPINLFLKLLYLLFSYNRKIIAPIPRKTMECTCEPPRSILWRTIFIVLLSFVTYINVGWYFENFLSEYLLNNPVHDFILLASQIGFQWIAFILFREKNSYDYLGHLVFTSFLGSFVLLFFGLALKLVAFTGIHIEFLSIICYGIAILFLFLEHKKRTQLKGWTWKLSISWVVFRVLIYPLVFQL